MNKIFLRLALVVITIVFFASSSFAVLFTERSKKIEKLALSRQAKEGAFNNWTLYQKSNLENIQAIQKQNRDKMAEIQTQYNQLLARQPDLIAQRAVPIKTTVTLPQQTQKFMKPQSKPVTKTS